MDLFLFSFLALILIFTHNNIKLLALANGSEGTKESNGNKLIIGAILDNTCRIGKEQSISMQLAIEDLKGFTNQSLILHVKHSHKEPVQAALAAKELIIRRQVKAILGPQPWEETSVVGEVGSKFQTPILSFSDSAPKSASHRWPFLLQVSPNKIAQMKAIADIVRSWEWHQVTVIYEEIDSSIIEIMPYFSNALQEVGAEITHVLSLSSFSSSSSLSDDLGSLKRRQCRVFVVHLSFLLATRLFAKAKAMKMMEKEYVWITTDTFTSLVHSINASFISSMKGVIGVKAYFLDNEPRFEDFFERFRRRFRFEYPEETNHEPGIFAAQAYDAVWIVGQALKSESKFRGQDLLEKILASNFDGLTGNIQFKSNKVSCLDTFQIINVMGKSYGELGFWSNELGFSKTINTNATSLSSMKDLGQVLWPGGPLSIPRGWALQTDSKPLRIGVPIESTFKQYVLVEFDQLQNATCYKGYAIELFKAAVKKLPFHLPYEFFPFNGTYDDLVKQIHLKNFDAAVGDIAIVASRFRHAEFTHPYTESELEMIVPVRSKSNNKTWLFMRPFTKGMWVLVCIINIYNDFVIWFIERSHCSELRGSILNQMGILLWLSFTTLFSLQGSKLHSNLSRMAMVVWLFVALILTQTYTANLSSMLTTQGLGPSIDSVESLQNSNEIVGHFGATFVSRYLEDVLHFSPKNLKNYSSHQDCVKDLRNGEIAAVFLEKPVAKLFLATYCNGFTTAGPSFKVGGYGIAFPRGSPLLHDVTEALIKVTESGQLQELEKNMIASQKCATDQKQSEEDDETLSLSPSSYWMLFIFTGGTSTIALLIYFFYHKHQSRFFHKSLWILICLAMVARWRNQRNQLPQRLNTEAISTPRNSFKN